MLLSIELSFQLLNKHSCLETGPHLRPGGSESRKTTDLHPEATDKAAAACLSRRQSALSSQSHRVAGGHPADPVAPQAMHRSQKNDQNPDLPGSFLTKSQIFVAKMESLGACTTGEAKVKV